MISEEKLLSDGMLVEAREASDEDLLVVHTRRYLNELKVQGQGPGAATGQEEWPWEGQLSLEKHSQMGSIPVHSSGEACESVVHKRGSEVS